MIDMERFKYEISSKRDFHFWFNKYDIQFRRFGKFFLAFSNNACRKRSRKDRRVAKLFKKVWNTADMIVVTMGDNYPTDIFFFSAKAGDIGNYVINAMHVFLRELQTHV